MMKRLEIEKLKIWFLDQKRDLPWRNNPTPYAVWISEVMLQQTQVAVVVPYFLRWMQRFPTISALAEASLDEVIKQWEGLGYYSRARYLHEGAQAVVGQFNGELPQTEAQLKQIKGLGPYTIGAILSFAFHQRKAAVDGNVIRVLVRYFQLEEDVTKSSTLKKLRILVEEILPEDEHWLVSEGLIELGATICQRKAQCTKCPLQRTCLAYQNGVVEQLPIKSKAMKTSYLYRAVAVICCGDLYLIKRGQKGKIMSDLHEFPYFEVVAEGMQEDQFKQRIQDVYQLDTQVIQTLPEVLQSFTRYQAKLNPVLFRCPNSIPVAGLEWMTLASLKKLAFSSGHRRIFEQVQAVQGQIDD